MPVSQPAKASSPTPRLLGRSIFAKQLTFFLLFILLISGVTSILFFTTARQHLEEEIGQKLQYIARIAAHNTPFDRLELIQVGADQSRMVLRLKEKLGQIQQATGVRSIFAFRPDRVSLLDLAPDVAIGTTYPLGHFTPRHLQQLKLGNSIHTAGYLSTGGETVISAFAPIFDEHGQFFAIIGVDAGAAELDIIEHLRNRQYWLTFACVGGAVLLALFLARSITSPIRQIAQTADQLGRGQYEARAQVLSQDEVGILAEAINRMAEQVRNRDAALKEMAASVAHEIRNPLNSIKLLIALLDEELGADKQPAQISVMETLHYEIGKLNNFIEEYLTFARPITLIRDQVEPASLVASVHDLAAAQAQEGRVHLDTRIAAGLAPVSVDRMRLEQTLLNLVLNAVQACQGGGRVVLSTSPGSEGGIDFAVEDTGSGIDDDAWPQLFEPFFTTKAEGTGLGLANARKIVEEHQGRIDVENRPEGGARFVVHLPAARLSPTA